MTATHIIIGINVLVFIGQLVTGGFGIPNLISWGAMVSGTGITWRIITSMFLHGGLLHLLMNMYALNLIGPFIEQQLGSFKFTLFYLGSGVIGGIIVSLMSQGAVTVGASGAIFGLFAYMVLAQSVPDLIKRQYIGLVVFNMLYSFITPGISVLGHAGGFIGGALLTYLLKF